MNLKKLTLLVSSLTVLVIAAAMDASAGVTGKIAGSVSDATTGDPIVGATIRLAGTNLGTKTDEDGEFFIINIPSGKYDVSVSTVGYETITRVDVRVLVDLTTPVSFDLNVAPVEVAGTVVVEATEPPVQADLTESKMIFTSDKLRSLPNTQTVEAVLSNYPGVTSDDNGELHVRGGRAGQTVYYYDRFEVQDRFVNRSGIPVMPEALSELSLSSGGYSSEYGGALSGVLNAVTMEGGQKYQGRIRSFQGATHTYDVNAGNWNSIKTNANRSLYGEFSGPIFPGKQQAGTFFAAAKYRKDPTYLPQNWTIEKGAELKMATQPMPSMKIIGNYKFAITDGRLYTHRDQNGISYDLNLDGLPRFEKKSYVGGLSVDYLPNERTVMSANIGRFYTYTKSAPDHLFDLYWDQWPGYSEDISGSYNGTIDDDNYSQGLDYSDPRQAVGFTIGDNYLPKYSRRSQLYNTGAFEFTSQFNRRHQLKAGFDGKWYTIEWDSKQFYNDKPYGEKYTSDPFFASAYFNDKMEYDNLIINAGFRYDHFSDDFVYHNEPSSTATNVWSPRLGISFPITAKSVMHFNYGYYYQFPQFTYLYTALDGDISTGLPLLGNPFLKPEKDVMYELGLDYVTKDDLRFDITAFYKDIRDLVTTRNGGIVAGNVITVFDNGDYGSSKGFDLSIEKLKGQDNYYVQLSYTYMTATGNSSYATEPYYTYLNSTNDTLAPVTEYPLDFDQRHTATAVFSFTAPKDWKQKMFGIQMPTDWSLTLIGQFGSGMPYTKTDSRGFRLGERNEGRLPSTFDVDMRFQKQFGLARKQGISFFVEVDNLFNRKNVIDVYSRTGLASSDGYRPGGGFATNQQDLDYYDKLFDNDPQNYAPPRTVRTGLEFTF